MRERLDRLIAGMFEAGVSRWISGTAGGLALLIVVAVLGASIWATRTAASRASAERAEAARGVAQLIAADADLLLRQSDLAGVRRQMIDVQASGLAESCRVSLAGIGVIASSDPAEIGVMTLPEAWADTAAVPEAGGRERGVVRASFEVPGRGAGLVELRYRPSATAYGGIIARAGMVGLVAVGAMWLVFRRMKHALAAMASVGGALNEVAKGERRASVLRLGDGSGPIGQAWNALLDERDEQDRLIAEHKTVAAETTGPGEGGGVVAVCDTMTHGMVVLDPEGRVAYVNGAAAVLLGRRREELERAETQAVFEDETVLGAVREALAAKGPMRRQVEIARGEPGRDPDAELRVTVQSSRPGEERFVGVLIEDITQQRVADRARNSFVAQATHELRTPLTNIRLYVEQAVDEGEEDPKLRAQALNVINSEARRLERIVSDMLSVAEIEAGSLSIRPGDVRTDALFDDLRNDYAAQAEEKTIELTFDLPPKLPVIRGDRDRLGQALHNLVGNALKYTPPGGKVTVKVDTPEAGGLAVHVADTGIGIDPDECERIFDRFYRANDRRIAHVTGSGLGLALAREIARLHGGDISVESKLDQGSTFTLSLPGPEEAPAKRAA